jgi:hypothetical protein
MACRLSKDSTKARVEDDAWRSKEKMKPKIATRKLDALVPAPYNPRQISDAALAGLTESLKRFGLVQPIVVNDRTGHVVGGHQRVKALQTLGETSAQVIVVDLDEKEEKALNLTLNNPHVAGDWTAELQDVLLSLDDDALSSLRLDELEDLTRPPQNSPEAFQAVDGDTLNTEHVCPKCGYEF